VQEKLMFYLGLKTLVFRLREVPSSAWGFEGGAGLALLIGLFKAHFV
jgi:hypothetical protein